MTIPVSNSTVEKDVRWSWLSLVPWIGAGSRRCKALWNADSVPKNPSSYSMLSCCLYCYPMSLRVSWLQWSSGGSLRLCLFVNSAWEEPKRAWEKVIWAWHARRPTSLFLSMSWSYSTFCTYQANMIETLCCVIWTGSVLPRELARSHAEVSRVACCWKPGRLHKHTNLD